MLEVHLGVYVSGKSQLIHEADVVVLTEAEGSLSRANSVPPRSHQCVLTVECKFYASNIGLSGTWLCGVALCAKMSETSRPSTITVGRGKKSHFDDHKQDKYFFRCVGS